MTGFDEAVDSLVEDGYPESLLAFLTAQWTSPIGFALGGTEASETRARFLADELRAMGYADARLEPVPLDVWTFKGASVTVGGETMTACSFAGVPPTAADGITGPVVDVGAGTAAEVAAAGDLRGRIALVDIVGSWWCWGWIEAALAGAAGHHHDLPAARPVPLH